MPPFRASLLGTIVNVQDMAETSQGDPKRVFDIVDSMGTSLPCCAIAHNALNRCLVEGIEAVFYHGTGRGPISTSKGMVYFMKDALIVPVGKKSTIPTTRMEIDMEV